VSDSQFLKHVPCPKCGSSDAGALYDDGHMHCFACSETIQGYDEDLADSVVIVEKKPNLVYTYSMENVEYKAIPERGITRATCEKYGVYANEQIHYYPYFNKEGKEVARKARAVETKSFTAHGNIKEATLFGQQLFHAGGKAVTICEGELDALAAFQMNGSLYPTVSIKNGAASAKKDCQGQYEWLNSFDSIVLAFDADEPGKKAAQEVAELFGSKCRVMKMDSAKKDACGYLQAGATKEFVNLWWRAEAYKPDGLINGNELWEDLQKPKQKPDARWPFKTIDSMLGGMRKRELVTIAAGTGQGKSTFLRQLIHHLLMTTDDKIGMAFLEESTQRTALGLMSIDAGKPLHLPDTEYTQEELKRAYDNTLGTGRCVLFSHFGSLDIDNVLNRLRFMAKGMDCQWLVLDHYQMILSGMDMDERKGLDMLLTKLRTFVEETGVGLFGVSHTRRIDGNKGLENGAEITLSSLRGTQGISQLSDAVVGLQRDQQNADSRVRNTTEVRILKSRFTGETGPGGMLYFNRETNRLEETEWVEEAL
jgi:twinkle protein